MRLHATTQQRPVDLWAVEQPLLRAVDAVAPYRLASHAVRTVSAECWVHYQGSRYSVPPAQVGQSVLVEVCEDQTRVVIRRDQVIVADHPRAVKRGEACSDPAHLAALWELTLAQSVPPPLPWQLCVADTVDVRPLSVYDALVS